MSLGPVMMDSGIFNERFLSQTLAQHQSGKKDHSAKIWALLMFEAFARRVLV